MARHRAGSRIGPPPPVPDWVAFFELMDWYDREEPVPLAEQVDSGGDVRYRCVQAYTRWQHAGQAWLGETGHEGSWRAWFRIVGWASRCDPHRLAREVRCLRRHPLPGPLTLGYCGPDRGGAARLAPQPSDFARVCVCTRHRLAKESAVARRRAPRQQPARSGERPPLWLNNMYAGLRHVSTLDPTAVMLGERGDLGALRSKLHTARRAWCAANGCYRWPLRCDSDWFAHNGRGFRRCTGEPVGGAGT